ncbi:MAG: arginine repressor [Lachnospiraceae bacterium]
MKTKRQLKILEIIRKENVETQEDLLKKLQNNGFPVTQATISRDIRELKLTKIVDKGGRQKYVSLEGTLDKLSEKLVRVFREGFLSMELSENILVIRTVSGMAMAVAAALDSMECEEVLGSIAGDDTVFSVVRTRVGAENLMDQLKTIAEQ